MNIKDLTLTEVCKKLAPYITDYFAGCEISGLDDNLFAESYLLGFEEVEHLIPDEHKSLFNVSDFLNGASGFLNFNYQAKKFRGREYTLMLLSNEPYTEALLLYVQEDNPSGDVQSDILIADFIKKEGLEL